MRKSNEISAFLKSEFHMSMFTTHVLLDTSVEGSQLGFSVSISNKTIVAGSPGALSSECFGCFQATPFLYRIIILHLTYSLE
jgi:hypothetical protein